MTVTINGTTGLATDSTSAVVEAVSLNHPSSSTAAITMDASNRVGIGTATPNRLLSLYDTQPVFQITNVASGNTQGTIMYQVSGDTQLNIDNQGSGSGGAIAFLQAGAERLRILSGGGITFNGDTAAANALDDYEETSWSPFWSDSNGNAIFNASPTVYQGKAIKIGSKVTAWGWHQMPSSFSTTASYAGTGGLFIGGLPYSSTTVSTEAYGGAVNYFNGWTGWAAGYTPMCYVGGNMDRIQLVYPITNTITSLPQSHVNSANSSIMVMVCYQTT